MLIQTPQDCEPEVIVISAPTVSEVSEADQDQVKRAKSRTDPKSINEQSPSTEDVAEETTLPSSATEERYDPLLLSITPPLVDIFHKFLIEVEVL